MPSHTEEERLRRLFLTPIELQEEDRRRALAGFAPFAPDPRRETVLQQMQFEAAQAPPAQPPPPELSAVDRFLPSRIPALEPVREFFSPISDPAAELFEYLPTAFQTVALEAPFMLRNLTLNTPHIQRVAERAAEFEEATGQKATPGQFFRTLEAEQGERWPGVRGALEMLPYILGGSALRGRGKLLAKGTTGPAALEKLPGTKAALARGAAGVLDPLAEMEALTGAAFGAAVRPLVRRLGRGKPPTPSPAEVISPTRLAVKPTAVPPAPALPAQKAFEPEDVLARIVRERTPGEKPGETLLRVHAGALQEAETEAAIIVAQGKARLESLGIGKSTRDRLVLREQDIPELDELFNALNNPSAVARGEVAVPAKFADDYTSLRDLTDWEEGFRLDFDSTMATIHDYFYRGWKPPKGLFTDKGIPVRGQLGRPAPFTNPRVDASYQEMRELGFEPLFWNPYEQWRVSRLQGVRQRQQMELIRDFKDVGLARPDATGKGIEGWRTPRVGPAFEGKPFTAKAADGTDAVMWTQRWVLPDEFAKRLENMYGVAPSPGKVHVGGKEVDLLKVVDAITFLPKRFKLFGTVFQQKDFLTRSFVGSWTKAVDELKLGRPVSAVKSLAVWPKSAYQMIQANLGPQTRLKLKQTLNSTTPILPDRPGVNFRGIQRAGLSTIDVTILPGNIDEVARTVATESGLLGVKKVTRLIGDIESAMRRGLFEGIYPAAQITDIRNNIAPMLARQWPSATDAQLNGMIARITNIKYSTIPASQSVFQNQVLREVLRRVFFSIGESEGLLKQGVGAIRGPQAAFWRKHWIGAYIGVIAVANAIHFASTGQPLPAERWTPISKTNFGALPIGYNRDFASPNIPLTDRTSTQLMIDLMDQLDTVFRVLDPGAFLSSRESVPIRAVANQYTGTDFFGQPIDEVGPGGIISRTLQLATDLFAPIGFGQAGLQIAREVIPGAKGLIPEGESRIGLFGHALQSVVINVEAASTPRLLNDVAQSLFAVDYDALEPYQRDEVQAEPTAAEELERRSAKAAKRGDRRTQYFVRLDEIDTARGEQLESLATAKRRGRIKINELRSRYFDIEGEAFIRRQEASENFEVEFEAREDGTPGEVALSEWYGLNEKADVEGVFDYKLLNALRVRFDSKWRRQDPEALSYVRRNTNRRDVPRGVLDFLPASTQNRRKVSERARSQHRPARSGAQSPDLDTRKLHQEVLAEVERMPAENISQYRQSANNLRDLGYRDTLGRPIDVGNYIRHEAAEILLVRRGVAPDEAHRIAASMYGAGPDIQAEAQANAR